MPLGIGIYLLLLTMLTGPMIWSKVPNACAALFTDTSGGLAKQLLGPSKSHRLRPLGIPFLLMILGSKGVALFYLLGQESQTLLLQVISVGAIARLSVLQTLTFNDPISRPRNFVLSIKDPDRVSGIAMAGVGSLALGLMGWKLGLLGLGMAWIVAAALSKIAQRKHGGVSLGILGLSSELVEVGLLFVLAIS